MINLLHETQKYIYYHFAILEWWRRRRRGHPSSRTYRTGLPCIFSAMIADDLATQWDRASAAMVLNLIAQVIPVSAPEGHNCSICDGQMDTLAVHYISWFIHLRWLFQTLRHCIIPVVRSSYFYDGNSHAGKTTSLYSEGLQGPFSICS